MYIVPGRQSGGRLTPTSMPALSHLANSPLGSTALVAHNVRRLMAKHGLTYEDVVEASGLDSRTIRGIVRGVKQPHAKTVRRLAESLGVASEELFAAPTGMTAEAFDLATNPLVAEQAAARPDLFEDWTPSDYAELASRFGVGGALTAEGVLREAQRLNENRDLIDRARLVLESDQADVLAALINVLHQRVTSIDRQVCNIEPIKKRR